MNALNKKIIATTLAVTLSAVAVTGFAKGQGQSEFDAAERFNYIFTELNLTEAQQTEVASILETTMTENREAMKALRAEMRELDESERPSREDMKAQREATKEARLQALTDELNTVLSADDTEAFVSYLEAHSHDKKGGKGKGKRGERDMDQRDSE